ncbi:hypothetical protein C4556_00545 [Candidatus Parcubacteria bacterium]|nr:MAG: hypothetical protein C4556_00545 [Candidatus Parcubacteria bacterium]
MGEKMPEANQGRREGPPADRRAELSRDEEYLLPQVHGAQEAIKYVFGDVLLKQQLNGKEQEELLGLKTQLMIIERQMQTKPPNRATEEGVAKTINAAKLALAKIIPRELHMFDLDGPLSFK